MNISLFIVIGVLYLGALCFWIYKRFINTVSPGKSVKLSEGTDQLVLEQGGQKVVIDYDTSKSKVVVEFNESGMTFKVIDGRMYQDVGERLPTKRELIAESPSDDEEIVAAPVGKPDADMLRELAKAKGSGVSTL